MNHALKKRNVTLDFIRTIAILAVIMIHCSGAYVTNPNILWYNFMAGNVFYGISRIGVPLFLMVSGSLLLDENKTFSLKQFAAKNIKNIALITITWSVIYATIYSLLKPIFTGQGFNLFRYLSAVLSGHYHMWYLYMIIGIYLAVPFLRCIVNKKNVKLVELYLIISIFIQFTQPVISVLSRYNQNIQLINTFINQFSFRFFCGYIPYFISGWYLTHIGIHTKAKKYLLHILGILSIVLCLIYVQITRSYSTIYQVLGLPVYLYSVSVFLTLHDIGADFGEKQSKILYFLAKLSFGAYIIHPIIQSFYRSIMPTISIALIHILLEFFIVVTISFALSYLLSKIPFLKKLVRF